MGKVLVYLFIPLLYLLEHCLIGGFLICLDTVPRRKVQDTSKCLETRIPFCL